MASLQLMGKPTQLALLFLSSVAGYPLPNVRQLDFMELESTQFMHFGIDTGTRVHLRHKSVPTASSMPIVVDEAHVSFHPLHLSDTHTDLLFLQLGTRLNRSCEAKTQRTITAGRRWLASATTTKRKVIGHA